MFHIHTQNKQISVWRQSNVGVKQQFFIENFTLLFDSNANTEKKKSLWIACSQTMESVAFMVCSTVETWELLAAHQTTKLKRPSVNHCSTY